jgi:CheY-like chemotaxis protein
VSQPGRRILIADDNRDWTDGLALLLRDQGYAVRTAYDGQEAISAAREFQPHVVILDVSMPRMTGYEAGRVLSQQPAGTRPILIAITAWPRDSGKLEAEMLSGFDHYVGKSRNAAEILELVKRV